MQKGSLFNDEPSIKLQKVIKEHGEVYTNSTILRQNVENHINKIMEETSHNEFINVKLAKKIKDICLILIDGYDKGTTDEQKYINAAVNYFIATDDEEKDLFSPLGFDDDVEILNECLKLIGKLNLTIDM
ncbi:hypothetical protein ACIQWQ_07885 [Peribacillus frigoritolerans]